MPPRLQLLIFASLAIPLFLIHTPPLVASDVRNERLTEIFAGGVPESLEDLRAMEDHFEGLADRLRPVTVGVRIGGSQGSGVIVSKDGLILTAAHVIGRGAAGRRTTLILHDGREITGKTLGADHDADSGLIQITTPNEGDWPHVELGKSSPLKSGQWCIATGHPGGYEVGRSPPVRVGRVLRNRRGFVTTDCILVGGDSGGPLFDMDGRVIGIHSRITRSTAGNLHVQIDAFHEDWDRLEKGDVWPKLPPYLGVYLDDRAENARIDEVIARGPAGRAGIKDGDVVVEFGGKPVKDNRQLRARIAEHDIGDKVKVRLERGEESLEVEVQLGRRRSR